MAEEVGSAYISLLPSLRGFSKRVKAALVKELRGVDVSIPVTVRPEIDRKTLVENLVGKRPLKIPVDLVQRGGLGKLGVLRQKVQLDVDQGGLLGRLFAGKASVTQKLKVDVDKNSLRDSAGRSASLAGGSVGRLFTSGFGSSLLNPLVGIPAVVAAALLAVPLGAAIAAATVLGGGLAAVVLGAFVLKDDPQLRAAVTDLFGGIKATMLEAAKPLKGPFLEAIRLVGEGFRDIAPDIKEFFATIGKSGGIQELGRGLKGFLKSFAETGALKKLAEAIGPALSQLGMALPDIGNALSQFLIEVSRPETIQALGTILRGTADVIRVLGDVIGYLTAQFDVWVTAMKWAGERIEDIKVGLGALTGVARGDAESIKQVGSAILGLFDGLVGWIIGLAQKLRSGLDFSSTVAAVKALPAKILAGLGNFGNLLYSSGRNVVQGLIDGIMSKIGALANVAHSVAQTLSNFFPNSPAKMGPLSGSGSTFESGQVIANDMAAGVQSRLPTVATAASQLAGSFGTGRSANATAPAPTQLTIAGDGRIAQLLIEVLKQAISDLNGGNVQAAMGS